VNTPDTTTSAVPGPLPTRLISSGRHLRIVVAHHSDCGCDGCGQGRAELGGPAGEAFCDTCRDPAVLARYDGQVTHCVTWPCPLTARSDYGPQQAATRLGLAVFQLERAVAAGVVPAPTGGRWPGSVIDEAAARIDAIVAAVGTLPDMGAVRAAVILTDRLGAVVTADAVVELSRAGLLPVVGDYRGHALYDGRALETFTDTDALTRAARDGQLLTRAEAAERLGVRRVDVEHLLAAGLLQPAGWGLSPWQSRRSRPQVPLLRAGDLDALLADPRIDWAGVRAAGPGRPSPLRHLTPGTGTGAGRAGKRGAR
jgi:hypothetical protein